MSLTSTKKIRGLHTNFEGIEAQQPLGSTYHVFRINYSEYSCWYISGSQPERVDLPTSWCDEAWEQFKDLDFYTVVDDEHLVKHDYKD